MIDTSPSTALLSQAYDLARERYALWQGVLKSLRD